MMVKMGTQVLRVRDWKTDGASRLVGCMRCGVTEEGRAIALTGSHKHRSAFVTRGAITFPTLLRTRTSADPHEKSLSLVPPLSRHPHFSSSSPCPAPAS